MRFLALLLILTSAAFGQRVNTLPGDCVRIQDGACIDKDELGFLDGVTSALQTQLDTITNDAALKANDADVVHLTGDETVDGVKTFTGKVVTSSTANGSVPCPIMTEAQRDAIASPSSGDCVYNSDSLQLNVYNGTLWRAAGGGISDWQTGFNYSIGDVVIESNKIYQANTAHTSTTFQDDIGNWTQLSVSDASELTGVLALDQGGTEKALTAESGGVVYTDADSMEVSAAGSEGQVLQSNGAAAPTWVNKSISGKAGDAASVTVEELQFSKNHLTETGTNTYRAETGNKNLLENPGFEHSTIDSGWTISCTGDATATATADTSACGASRPCAFGAKTLSLEVSGGDSGGTCTIYQDAATGIAADFMHSIWAKADTAGKVKAYFRRNEARVTGEDHELSVLTAWKNYSFQRVSGSTHSGVEVETTVAASETVTVDLDEAHVGFNRPIQQVPMCETAECTTLFSASFTSAGVATEGEGFDWINGNASVSETSIYTITFNSDVFTVTPKCWAQAKSGSNIEEMMYAQSASGITVQLVQGNTVATASAQAFDLWCKRDGADYTAAIAKGTGNVISAQNKDTGWESCGHTTSDFTGFGTVTNIETQCKRDGDDLLMRGSFVSSGGTTTEARLALKFKGESLSIASSVAAGSSTGRLIRGAANANNDNILLLSSGLGYVTVGGTDNGTTSPLASRTGNNIVSTGETLSLKDARIPIAGWEDSNLIVAELKDVVKTPGTSNGRPVLCSWTNSSTNSRTSEFGGCVASSIYSSGQAIYTFNSDYWAEAPNCVCISGDNNGSCAESSTSEPSTTNYAFFTREVDHTLSNFKHTVFCHGVAK